MANLSNFLHSQRSDNPHSVNKTDVNLGNVPNEDATNPMNWDPANTNGNFLVGDGSTFVAENGATARASLGLGTQATNDQHIAGSSQNTNNGDITYVV